MHTYTLIPKRKMANSEPKALSPEPCGRERERERERERDREREGEGDRV